MPEIHGGSHRLGPRRLCVVVLLYLVYDSIAGGQAMKCSTMRRSFVGGWFHLVWLELRPLEAT